MTQSATIYESNVVLPEGTLKEGSSRILLVDSDRRPYTPRIAMAFMAMNCDVSIVCTQHHPIEALKGIQRFSYSAVHPASSLLRAIECTMPDLVVPCDDRAVEHLHKVYIRCANHSSSVIRLLERSLGPPGSYHVALSRYALLRLAEREGIRVPKTECLQTIENLTQWTATQSAPWVLKADGTWGGGGVRITSIATEAESAFHTLSVPCGVKRAVKYLVVHRDAFYLRDWWCGRSRPVIAQAYIKGRPANCAVACWEGRVIAQTSVEVISASSATGPAEVVRLVNNAEMTAAAEKIAKKLHLSGFFGLDFMIEKGSEATYLIEMNPRCTPLSHVSIPGGADMVGAMSACLSGWPTITRVSEANEHQLIAYFPQAWQSQNELLNAGFKDYPYAEPELAKSLLHPYPQRAPLYRLVDFLTASRSSRKT